MECEFSVMEHWSHHSWSYSSWNSAIKLNPSILVILAECSNPKWKSDVLHGNREVQTMGIVFRLQDLCSFFFFFFIFIVYIVGKSLLILRNKTVSLRTFFFKFVSKNISLELYKTWGPLEIHCPREWTPGEWGIFMTPLKNNCKHSTNKQYIDFGGTFLWVFYNNLFSNVYFSVVFCNF